VSKATVYNTLNLFVDQGLAREIHADPERCVYDSTMTRTTTSRTWTPAR